MNFRSVSLAIAESFDAWRIIPRIVLILYSTLVFNLYMWYKSIPTYVQIQCDPGTLRVLMEAGMLIDDAKEIACAVADIVGGPTAAQSAFVTTIVGLSTGIFGLYVATGRKWDRGFSDNDDRHSPFPYPGTNYNDYNTNPSYGPSNPSYGPSNPSYGPNRPYGPRSDGRPYGPSPQGPWGSQGDGGGNDIEGDST